MTFATPRGGAGHGRAASGCSSLPVRWPPEVAARRHGERDGAAHAMAQALRGRRRPPFPCRAPSTLRTATAAPALSLRPVARDPWAAPRCAGTGTRRTWTGRSPTMAALRGPGRGAGPHGAAGHRRLVPGLRGGGSGTAAGVLGGAGLGAGLAREHPSRGRGGRWRALVRAGADLAGDGALPGLFGDEGQALLDGAANLRCGLQDHGGDGAARWRGVAGDARRGGRLGPVPLVAKARGHAAMAAGAGLLPGAARGAAPPDRCGRTFGRRRGLRRGGRGCPGSSLRGSA
jgi:hypothetical protein